MSTPFQNRLVGTVIVAAVAIIFLPDLLDGEKQTYQEQFEKIPTAPTVDFSPKQQRIDHDKISQLPDVEVSDEIALDDNEHKEITDQTVPEDTVQVVDGKIQNDDLAESASALTDSIKNEQAWVIQLGSFRHQKNVEELTRKLKSAGYTVFTRPINTKSGTLTKVFIGPEIVKATLEKKLPALKELTKVQGKIARFQPTKQ